MEINDTIRRAIESAVRAAGGQSAFGRKVGINRQNVCKYLNGTIPTMTYDSWELLYPHIKTYLPDGFSCEFQETNGNSRRIRKVTVINNGARFYELFGDELPTKETIQQKILERLESLSNTQRLVFLLDLEDYIKSLPPNLPPNKHD